MKTGKLRPRTRIRRRHTTGSLEELLLRHQKRAPGIDMESLLAACVMTAVLYVITYGKSYGDLSSFSPVTQEGNGQEYSELQQDDEQIYDDPEYTPAPLEHLREVYEEQEEFAERLLERAEAVIDPKK